MPVVEKWKLGCKLLVGKMPGLFCFASILLCWRIIDPGWPWIWIKSSLQHYTVACCSCERVLCFSSKSKLMAKVEQCPLFEDQDSFKIAGWAPRLALLSPNSAYIPAKLLSFPTPSGQPSALLPPPESRVRSLPVSTSHSCPICMCLIASFIKKQRKPPPCALETVSLCWPYRLPWYWVPSALLALWVTELCWHALRPFLLSPLY